MISAEVHVNCIIDLIVHFSESRALKCCKNNYNKFGSTEKTLKFY